MQNLKVAITGAYGRIGREALKGVLCAEDLQLVGAVDIQGIGIDVGTICALETQGIFITADLEDILQTAKPEVLVDFTCAEVAMQNSMLALRYGTSPVIGTTGLKEEDIDQIHLVCEQKQIGAVVAPNFALGAILMIRFAKEAAKFFTNVEIIEMHHDKKIDAPSGTALSTAHAILQERGAYKQGHPDEIEKISGVRGASISGLRLHSIRLPGLLAHQEVIFGDIGQTLTIRHDTTSRESFIPGMLLAIRKVRQLRKAVFGLENLL